MKNFKKLWAVALMLFASFAMVSCDDEEPIVDIEEGLNVADGYYFVVEGDDPVAERSLLAETVEGENFAAVERVGFFGNYVYLEAGAYQLQKVESKEVTSTLGGALETVDPTTLTGEEPFNSYDLAMLAEGGAALSVAADGLYKVTYDEATTELIVMLVEKVSFIGAPSGWGDAEMTTVSSNPTDGFVYNASGLEIRGGAEYKIRINNAWKIIRNNDAGTGYVAFTNYGGSADNLVAGGSNIGFAGEDGAYTAEVTLQNDGGAFLSFENTGDIEPITFDPNEYQFGAIGDATAGGWDTDQNFFYKGVDGDTHTWVQVVTFAAEGSYLLITNDEFTFKIGGVLTPTESATVVGGENIATPGAGAFYIKIQTSDEGETWNISMSDIGWGLIGDGGPSASWDTQENMVSAGFADGVSTYTFSGEFAGGPWKFRAGNEWVYDLGGSLDALSAGGSNIETAAGAYDVVLSFDGTDYSATVTAQ